MLNFVWERLFPSIPAAFRLWLHSWIRNFLLVFYLFPNSVSFHCKRVGRFVIFNIVRERLPRSVLAYFPSCFIFGNPFFYIFTFVRLLKIFYYRINVFFWVWISQLISLEICVGGPFTLNIVWERVSRSLLTAARFWLEFRKSTSWYLFCTFFPTFDANYGRGAALFFWGSSLESSIPSPKNWSRVSNDSATRWIIQWLKQTTKNV